MRGPIIGTAVLLSALFRQPFGRLAFEMLRKFTLVDWHLGKTKLLPAESHQSGPRKSRT